MKHYTHHSRRQLMARESIIKALSDAFLREKFHSPSIDLRQLYVIDASVSIDLRYCRILLKKMNSSIFTHSHQQAFLSRNLDSPISQDFPSNPMQEQSANDNYNNYNNYNNRDTKKSKPSKKKNLELEFLEKEASYYLYKIFRLKYRPTITFELQ